MTLNDLEWLEWLFLIRKIIIINNNNVDCICTGTGSTSCSIRVQVTPYSIMRVSDYDQTTFGDVNHKRDWKLALICQHATLWAHATALISETESRIAGRTHLCDVISRPSRSDDAAAVWSSTPVCDEISLLTPAETDRTQRSVPLRVLFALRSIITPPPVGTGSGVLFSLDFFFSFFLCMFLCFFVSKVTRKRLDRFAWNFQGRCGMTTGRSDSILGQFG